MIKPLIISLDKKNQIEVKKYNITRVLNSKRQTVEMEEQKLSPLVW